jgi:hypothetical protein
MLLNSRNPTERKEKKMKKFFLSIGRSVRDWFSRKKDPVVVPPPVTKDPVVVPPPVTKDPVVVPPPVTKDPETERPSPNEAGVVQEWIPWAEILEKKMPTAGEFSKGYPEGMVVHFTAGSSAESSISWGKEQGYAFFMVKKDGTLVQTHSLKRWGHHAGSSSWPGLGSGISNKTVGVEVDCAGGLDMKAGKLTSWFGRVVPERLARYSKANANIKAGWYEAYTPEQEDTLFRLAVWLKKNNPKVFNLDYVVGHDEVAPARKNDPGAALSMTMPEFRRKIKEEYMK